MTKFGHVYKGVRIVVAKGAITSVEVDAIVNAANSILIMGGGVAGAILRTGGRTIQEEALKYAPVPVGKAVPTGAGKLKAKSVIHAPTTQRPAMRISKDNVRLATAGALECAELLKIVCVAFPGMGTGVGGLKPKEAAEAMVQEVKKYIDKGGALKKITLVGYTEDLTHAFLSALRTSLP